MMNLKNTLRNAGIATLAASFALFGSAAADIPDALETVGKSDFYVGWIHVYDAELRSPDGTFDWSNPFELELTYARDISKKRFVNATLDEMKRHTGKSASDLAYMRTPLEACFSDANKGDRYLARRVSDDVVEIELNDVKACDLDVQGASKLFFGIWLSDKTRSDKKSEQLRGLR